VTGKLLSNEELDALVVTALARLPVLSPSRGFADSVMAQVQLPRPLLVRHFARFRAWISQPRRALAFAGGYIVAASIALVVAVPWLVERMPAIEFAWRWVASGAATSLRDASLAVASWWVTSGLSDVAGGLPTSGAKLWMAVLALTFMYGGCAIGLHRLLRAPRMGHAPARV
jgi:hypothetical protein